MLIAPEPSSGAPDKTDEAGGHSHIHSTKPSVLTRANSIATDRVQQILAGRMASCFSVQHIYCALSALFADPVSVGFGWSKKI